MLRLPITFATPPHEGNLPPGFRPVAGGGLPSEHPLSVYGSDVVAIPPNRSVYLQPSVGVARLRSPIADPAVTALLAGAGALVGSAAFIFGAKPLWRGAMELVGLPPRWRRSPVTPVSPEQLSARPHVSFSATQLLVDPGAAARVSEAMWRDSRLMDYYLSLCATSEQYAEALPDLIRIESAWLDYFGRRAVCDLATQKRAVLVWMGGDACEVQRHLDDLDISDIATLHTCLLMRDFLYGQTRLERWRMARTFKFNDNADALTLVRSDRYDCNSISTLILHLWQLLPPGAGVNTLKSFSMPGHASLLVPLSGGRSLIFNNGKSLGVGINNGDMRVMLDDPATYAAIAREPWQIMAGNLVDLAHPLTVGKKCQEAETVGALIGLYGAALAIDPDEHNANIMMAQLFIAMNNHPEGRRYAGRALKYYQEDWQTHLMLALSFMTDDLVEAEAHLSRAEKSAPHEPAVKNLRHALEGIPGEASAD